MQTLCAALLRSHLLPQSRPVSADLWRALRPPLQEGEHELGEWATRNFSQADAARVQECLQRSDEAAEAAETLRVQGITLISEFDEQYPAAYHERLGDHRPALLFATGRVNLLKEQSIGVVGSRDVDESGANFAAALGEEIARGGKCVISGGARGVDRTAMNGAYANGGQAIGVLSDSMLRVIRDAEMREAIDTGRVCLISQAAPSAPFNVGNAMARNKLIYAHSQGTVVVAAAEGSGGTWAGAAEALKLRLCPVLVRIDEKAPPANHKLLKLGARPLTSARALWKTLKSDPVEEGSLF